MSIIGNPWPNSPVHVFTDDAGQKVTLTIHEYGGTLSDAGGTTQLAHVVDTDDPDVKMIGAERFRRIR